VNPNSYRQLESKIVTWATNRPDIRAVLIVGSQARTIRPADEFADLDLVLLTLDAELYRPQLPDIDRIAPLWLVVPSQVDPTHVEWLVLFAGGFKVDFYFAPIAERASLAETLPHMPFQGVLARGLRVLLDKTGIAAGRDDNESADETRHVAPSNAATSWPPAFERFQAEANSTLLSASRAVKFIRRNDLWRAKFQVDTDLKRRLLTFIEWQAQAATGRMVDTWYDGRFMTDWATPDVLKALPQTFGAFAAGDLLRALEATLALFNWLARDTAGRLGYGYPQTNQESVLDWLSRQIELTQSEIG
jgi:aminoglycoside 6-adenylyltransferase